MFGTLVISACQEPNYQNEKVAEREIGFSESNEESDSSEYLIVLEENISITTALNNLQKYEVRVIKNLKKGRYLIELKQDPGIEQLRKDLEGSEHIKQIQTNFIYTIQ